MLMAGAMADPWLGMGFHWGWMGVGGGEGSGRLRPLAFALAPYARLALQAPRPPRADLGLHPVGPLAAPEVGLAGWTHRSAAPLRFEGSDRTLEAIERHAEARAAGWCWRYGWDSLSG
jgi:hypothetical protein